MLCTVGLPSVTECPENIQSQKNKTNLKEFANLFKPTFSEEGSNKRKFENEVYSMFMNYLRKVASTYFLSQ